MIMSTMMKCLKSIVIVSDNLFYMKLKRAQFLMNGLLFVERNIYMKSKGVYVFQWCYNKIDL